MGFWAKLDNSSSIRQLGVVTKDSDGCHCEADNLCDENKSLEPCGNDGEFRRSYPSCQCNCETECAEGWIVSKKDCSCKCADKIKCKRTERLNHETCQCEKRSADDCDVRCKKGYILNADLCECQCNKTCKGDKVLVPDTCQCRKAARADKKSRGGWRNRGN